MKKEELRKKWEERIAAYRASGLGVSAWCTANNLSSSQLWYWLRKFKREEASEQPKATTWLPLEISEPLEPENMLLIKVGQVSIEVKPGFDPTLLVEVVKTLSC